MQSFIALKATRGLAYKAAAIRLRRVERVLAG